jgi:hypothetical protein
MSKPKKSEQEEARRIQKEKGIKYTEALREVRSAQPAEDTPGTSESSEELIEVGTCRVCGQELISFGTDIWHPHNIAKPCSASPNLRPGAVNFILDEQATATLRENMKTHEVSLG